MQEKYKQVYDLVRGLYKNEDGSPVELTPSQCEIFASISMRLKPRIHCMTFTRFGKSRTTALAVLTRASTYPEKWAIIAPTKEKAKIIMSYINAHIFDNEYTASRFRMDKGDSAESIRRNRNKNHISFDVGNGLISEVFICSAKEALGFGASNVVEDESALIPNDEHALVMRMLGDNPEDNFLFKIGNPFNRNHFLDSYNDPAYHKIVVTGEEGIVEGRMNVQTLEEMKKHSFYDVLYDCKFPSAESVDEKGWAYLLTEEDIKQATARWGTAEKFGFKRLGNDVARGGRNFNVWAIRGDNWASIKQKNREADLMKVAGTNIRFMREDNISPENVFIDDTGVGGGVTDRMREDNYTPTAVKLAEKATELDLRYNPKTKKEELMPIYANMRSQIYAGKKGLANWIKRTGALDPDVDWSELTRIRYKTNSNGLVIIEPKDDMRKRGEESPDVADALALTFAKEIEEPMSSKEFVPPDPQVMLEQAKRNWQ